MHPQQYCIEYWVWIFSCILSVKWLWCMTNTVVWYGCVKSLKQWWQLLTFLIVCINLFAIFRLTLHCKRYRVLCHMDALLYNIYIIPLIRPLIPLPPINYHHGIFFLLDQGYSCWIYWDKFEPPKIELSKLMKHDASNTVPILICLTMLLICID